MPDFLSATKTGSTPETRPFPQERKDILASPETTRAPEIKTEQETIANQAEVSEEPTTAPGTQGHISPITERVVAPQNKSERLVGIEKVLSSGLEEIYVNLDDPTKQMLKIEGEKTATQIEAVLEQGKDMAKKILHLIRQWLHKIPGVNRFFLEQESKIKTDKIIGMRREE